MNLLRHLHEHRGRSSVGSAPLSKFSPQKLLRSDFVHNVIALYGVQACTYAPPLFTFPYLARVLGPSGWGVVPFSQASGVVIASVVEYGFDISASRETSLQRDAPERLSALISGVLGAKALLAIVCVAGAVVSRRFSHHIAPSRALFWSSTIWGVCQGINMLWFFQGVERMRLASALEIGGKVLATLSIFVLVDKPSDGWMEGDGGAVCRLRGGSWSYGRSGVSRSRFSVAYTFARHRSD
jgi:PST family polysaccharide transporter